MLDDDAVFEPGRRVMLSAASRLEAQARKGEASRREAQARKGEASREGPGRETEIESFRRQHGRCVAKFRGIDSISEAEKYVGNEIKIPADTLPAAKNGWLYTFQLKGCRVFAADGEYIGTVTDVLDAGGAEILKDDRENEETLIPFAQSYMKRIDLDQRRIEVDLPEGLRDLNK